MTGASSSSQAGYSGSSTPTAGPSYQPAPMPASVARQIFDADLIQQSSIYGMEEQPSGPGQPAKPVRRPVIPGARRETVIRKGSGKTWEDPTLIDWDPSGYRALSSSTSPCAASTLCFLFELDHPKSPADHSQNGFDSSLAMSLTTLMNVRSTRHSTSTQATASRKSCGTG